MTFSPNVHVCLNFIISFYTEIIFFTFSQRFLNIFMRILLSTLWKHVAVGWEGAISNDWFVWKYFERHSSANIRKWNLHPLLRTTKRSVKVTHFHYADCPCNWQDLHNVHPRTLHELVKEICGKFPNYTFIYYLKKRRQLGQLGKLLST